MSIKGLLFWKKKNSILNQYIYQYPDVWQQIRTFQPIEIWIFERAIFFHVFDIL